MNPDESLRFLEECAESFNDHSRPWDESWEMFREVLDSNMLVLSGRILWQTQDVMKAAAMHPEVNHLTIVTDRRISSWEPWHLGWDEPVVFFFYKCLSENPATWFYFESGDEDFMKFLSMFFADLTRSVMELVIKGDFCNMSDVQELMVFQRLQSSFPELNLMQWYYDGSDSDEIEALGQGVVRLHAAINEAVTELCGGDDMLPATPLDYLLKDSSERELHEPKMSFVKTLDRRLDRSETFLVIDPTSRTVSVQWGIETSAPPFSTNETLYVQLPPNKAIQSISDMMSNTMVRYTFSKIMDLFVGLDQNGQGMWRGSPKTFLKYICGDMLPNYGIDEYLPKERVFETLTDDHVFRMTIYDAMLNSRDEDEDDVAFDEVCVATIEKIREMDGGHAAFDDVANFYENLIGVEMGEDEDEDDSPKLMVVNISSGKTNVSALKSKTPPVHLYGTTWLVDLATKPLLAWRNSRRLFGAPKEYSRRHLEIISKESPSPILKRILLAYPSWS